jgi:hypothetical protein
MKGGFGCSPCCAPTDPCLECRQYTADTYYLSATASVTINGYAVPMFYSFDGARTFLDLTLPSSIQSSCFEPSNSPKVARFHALYVPAGFVDVDYSTGCETWKTYLWIYASLHNSSYFYNAARSIPSYIMGNCDDTGGAAIPGTWFYPDAVYLPEDCRIDWLDWLNSLTVVTTFAWDACECPP